MLLPSSMDPSKLISVEQRLKRKLKKKETAVFCHHQRAQLSHKWGRNSWSFENQLWNWPKIEVQWYLRVFFDLKDWVVVNAYIIYKTKVNARMRLFHFKVIFAKLSINRFSSRKQKFTSEELQLVLELPNLKGSTTHYSVYWETSTLYVLFQ